MKRTILVSIFALICFAQSYAQIFILNLKLGDCVSCYQKLSELNKDDLLWFGVFPSDYRLDSLDLIDRHNFDILRIPIIFNDTIYQLTKSKRGNSTVSLIKADGTIKWTKDLIDFPTDGLSRDSIVESVKQEKGYRIRREETIKYGKRNTYVLNRATGTIRYWSNLDSPQSARWIRPKDLKKSDIIKFLPEAEQTALEDAWFEVEASPVYSNTFKWIEISESEDCVYGLFNYYSYWIEVDSTLNQRFGIVKHDIESNKNTFYPIMFSPEHNYHNGLFVMKDSSTVYFLTSNLNEDINDLVREDNIPIYNLTEFTLRDHQYQFARKIPIDLPASYRKQYLYNYFSLNFSSYPFFGYRCDPTIHNIENNQSTNLLLNNPTYQYLKSKYDSRFFLDNFRLNGVVYDEIRKNIIVSFGIGDFQYASLYTPDLNLIGQTDLNSLFQYYKVEAGETEFIMTDESNNALVIYFTNDFIKLPFITFY